MTNNDHYTVDHEERVVSFVVDDSETLHLRVPAFLGAILSAQRRGDDDEYVVVTTEGGRVSYHVLHPNHTWRRAHPLAGRIHWHSIRKLLRDHCLIREAAKRVDFHVTHFPYKSGGQSACGAYGRITIDKQIIFEFNDGGKNPRAWELGAALAEYLFLTPQTAITSANVIVASTALLDRRLDSNDFEQVDQLHAGHPVWDAFHSLRASLRG